jgi:hypothetical protein
MITINHVSGPVINVSGVVEYAVNVAVPTVPQVTISVAGTQGPPGPGLGSVGPGFQLIGNELRYAIATLPRG